MVFHFGSLSRITHMDGNFEHSLAHSKGTVNVCFDLLVLNSRMDVYFCKELVKLLPLLLSRRYDICMEERRVVVGQLASQHTACQVGRSYYRPRCALRDTALPLSNTAKGHQVRGPNDRKPWTGHQFREQEKPLRIPKMHTCGPQGTASGLLQRRAQWPGSHSQQQPQLMKKMFASFPVLPCPYISTLEELKEEEAKYQTGHSSPTQTYPASSIHRKSLLKGKQKK